MAGEKDLPADDSWLAPREEERARTMRFRKRRTEYLLRRWVGKQAVAMVADLPRDAEGLRRLEVANRSSGAPYVLHDGDPLGLDLSLSDRAGWAVCLVRLVGREGGNLGCDLEIVEPRSAEFEEEFLTLDERVFVAAATERDVAANLVWSGKECALKVLQTGLDRDPLTVEVAAVDEPSTLGWQRLELRPQDSPTLHGWWRRDGSFLLTVAAELPLAEPELLPGSAELATARPVHTWMDQPGF